MSSATISELNEPRRRGQASTTVFLRVTAVFFFGWTLGPEAWAAADMSGTWLGIPKVVWAWANILVFWGFLWRVAGPGIREFLKKRREAIKVGLERAAEQEEEAKQMKAELSSQLEEFRRELEEQKERARVETARERERILAQAESDREKLLEQTEREIENQAAKARAELQQMAAGLAANLAADKVRGELDGGEQSRLFAHELQRLEQVAASRPNSEEAAS